MRSLSRASSGIVTAEWALALPAVIVVLGIGLAGLSLQLERGQLQRVSAQAARMASLGATEGEVRAEVGRQLGAGTSVLLFDGASGVSRCVGLRKDGSLAGLGGVVFPLEAQTCALKPPSSGG